MERDKKNNRAFKHSLEDYDKGIFPTEIKMKIKITHIVGILGIIHCI